MPLLREWSGLFTTADLVERMPDLIDSGNLDSKMPSVFAPAHIDFMDKTTGYRVLEGRLRALLAGERDPIANFANASALIFQSLPDLNWAGFYRLTGNELVLGPFQGRPACVRISVGQGVCGTAVARRETVLVRNVQDFPGHIACDAASKSEIVLPLLRDGRVLGVLDLDSPTPSRFDAKDQAGLESLVATLIAATDWRAASSLTEQS